MSTAAGAFTRRRRVPHGGRPRSVPPAQAAQNLDAGERSMLLAGLMVGFVAVAMMLYAVVAGPRAGDQGPSHLNLEMLKYLLPR